MLMIGINFTTKHHRKKRTPQQLEFRTCHIDYAKRICKDFGRKKCRKISWFVS